MLYDFETTNTSFLVMAKMLKNMGLKNYYFFLALSTPLLKGVNPWDPNLSTEMKALIMREAMINPWYFFRELVIMPDGDYRLKLDLGSLSLIWCLLHNLRTIIILPRQCFKSTVAASVETYLATYGSQNSNIMLFGNRAKLNGQNLARVKAIIDRFPDYLKPDDKHKDYKSNTEELSIPGINNSLNTIKTKAPGTSRDAATQVGRGNSTKFQWYDEFAFIKYIDVQYGSAIHAYIQSSNNAEQLGQPHHILMTTTCGAMDTEEGRWAHDFIKKATQFDIMLLDYVLEETDKYGFIKFDKDRIKRYITVNNPMASSSAFVYIEYNYIELGKDANYLKERYEESVNNGGSVDLFLREVLNTWVITGSDHPLGQNLVINLKKKECRPHHIINIEEFFFKMYKQKDTNLVLESSNYVCGMDYSGNGGRDFSTFVIVDIRDKSVVCTMRGNSYSADQFVNAVCSFIEIYVPYLTIIGERNAMGSTVLDYIYAGVVPTCNIYRDPKDKKIGKHMDHNLREIFYKELLRKTVKENGDKIYDVNIIREIATLEYGRNGRIDHAKNSNDDTLMAYLYAIWFIERATNKGAYIDLIAIDSKTRAIEFVKNNQELIGEQYADRYIKSVELKNNYLSNVQSRAPRFNPYARTENKFNFGEFYNSIPMNRDKRYDINDMSVHEIEEADIDISNDSSNTDNNDPDIIKSKVTAFVGSRERKSFAY